MLAKYYSKNISSVYDKLKKRTEAGGEDIISAVNEIIEDVKNNGDCAVMKYTEKFDKIKLENFWIDEKGIKEAANKCSPKLYGVIEKAARNIEEFHKKQLQNSYMTTCDGIIMGQRVIPLDSVALYVPGGSAAYPSSVLMNAIPAKIAGVREIIIITPPKDELNPAVAAAAKICGIKKILQVGGVQAVAAVAYGTQSIEKVDKIVGPGNKYVAAAKKAVFGTVDIDMIAGPSEILVIADETANPAYIAADLMSQAEHDIAASAILLTTSEKLIDSVLCEIESQIKTQGRSEIIQKSFCDFGFAVKCESMQEMLDISNKIAPEHLELSVEKPFEVLDGVKNAGSVFLGHYAPEPLGDYFAGSNHVLPTNGTARFSSPLGVDSFIKKSAFIYYSKERLQNCADDIIEFANSEGLFAHANSIQVRK